MCTGALTNLKLRTRNPFGIDEIQGGANVTFVVDWETPPPPPEIDENLVVEIDDGRGSHFGTDHGDGTYSFTTNKFTVSAYYTLDVLLTTATWFEVPVAGSPFLIYITPGQMDLSKIVFEGSGTTGGQVDPDTPAVFDIIPYDAFGNRYVPTVAYTQAANQFAVTLSGPTQDDGSIYSVSGTMAEQCVLLATV
jgi:hypothetical protein